MLTTKPFPPFLAGALVAACLVTSALVAPMALAKKTQLVISFWGSPEQLKTRAAINKEFEKTHPDIAVKLMVIDGASYWSKVSMMMATGTAPDVMFMDAAWGYTLASRGVFEDLGPRLRQGNFLDSRKYFTQAFESMRVGKLLYGLPTEMNGTVLWYNQSMMDEAGLTCPDDQLTWDPGFLELGRKLTRDTNGDGKMDRWGAATGNWYDLVENVIWSYGGEWIVNQEEEFVGDKKRAHLDMDQTMKALQFWSDLSLKYHIAARPGETGFAFASGKLGMELEGAWALDSRQLIKQFKWDMAIVPKQVKHSPTVGGWGLVMNKGSKNKAAAWELMKFHSTGVGQMLNGASGQAVPFERAAANSDAFLLMGGRAPKHHRVRLESIDEGRTRFRFVRRFPDIETMFEVAVGDLLAGRKSVQQLVSTLNPRITSILKGQ